MKTPFSPLAPCARPRPRRRIHTRSCHQETLQPHSRDTAFATQPACPEDPALREKWCHGWCGGWREFSGFALVACMVVALLLATSCQEFFGQGPKGTLRVNVPEVFPPSTRAASGFPDIGTFRVRVSDSAGQVVCEKDYAHFPDELSVPAGTYTVSAESDEFSAPAFDAPQWGDTQIVSVPAGGSVTASLACHQLNSGLRLDVTDSFREAFPAGTLSLKGPGGALRYPYSETRTAFFLPGAVALSLDDGGSLQTLLSRRLEASQMLALRLSANVSRIAGGIDIQLGTARTWLDEQFVAGEGDAHELDGAYDVAEARDRAGETGVWVYGYIVGVATNTRKVSVTPPFNKNTNLVLGARASTTDPDYCLSVELPAGAVRDALNLQDHPELLGRGVYIRGDLVAAYYGIPGLKAPSKYQFR